MAEKLTQKVSFYKDTFDRSGVEVNMLTILKAIHNGTWKEKVEKIRKLKKGDEYDSLKKSLPCATFSGTFFSRNDENIKDYTGFITIDIDKELIGLQLKNLATCPYIAAVFKSPSGKGRKILFEVMTNGDKHKTEAFPAIEYYFKSELKILIDPSGKNISRLCYVSYDPDMVVNAKYRIFDVYTYIKELNKKHNAAIKAMKSRLISNSDMEGNYEKILAVAKNWARKHHSFVKGDRNNYLYLLCNIMNRAGVQFETTLMCAHRDYPSMAKEIDAIVNSAYKHKNEHGICPISKSKGKSEIISQEGFIY